MIEGREQEMIPDFRHLGNRLAIHERIGKGGFLLGNLPFLVHDEVLVVSDEIALVIRNEMI